ncbi:MAG: Gfo/Idh/MocA family oxidoreductase, partial [Bacteroidetes bacterium]|nr:Gfo/Idh/MocA family oxidoreductase [Bacteroidota bacterium]
MIQIGIAGANEFSKKHIEKLKELKEFDLVGFYDHDCSSASIIQEKYNLIRFDSYEDMINRVEAVDILTPVGSHYQFVGSAIRKCKHVFVKQVLSENLEEAKELHNLADEANIHLYVSHHEKFHPNYQMLKRLLDNPFYIESARFDESILNYSPENLVFDMLLNCGKDTRPEISFFKRINEAEKIINKIFIFENQTGFTKSEYKTKGGFDLNDINKFYEEEIKKAMRSLNNDIPIAKKYPLIRCKYFIGATGACRWDIYKSAETMWKKYTEDSTINCPY